MSKINKRRIVFAFILAGAIALDMISTHLLVASGYRELTGIIVMMLDTSIYMLYLWVIFWWLLIYFIYPCAKKNKLQCSFRNNMYNICFNVNYSRNR